MKQVESHRQLCGIRHLYGLLLLSSICLAGCAVQVPVNLRVSWKSKQKAMEEIAKLPHAQESDAPTSIEWFVRKEFDENHAHSILRALEDRGFMYQYSEEQVVGALSQGTVRCMLAQPIELTCSLDEEVFRKAMVLLWVHRIPFANSPEDSRQILVPRKLLGRAMALLRDAGLCREGGKRE